MAALDTFPGLSEALGDVKSLLATEDSSESDADLEDSIPAPPEMGGGVLRIVPAESGGQEDRKEPREEDIKFTDLDEAQTSRVAAFPRVS